jgi:murein DD-endopeptidase MepM/ murein hydrolase activator NlpD
MLKKISLLILIFLIAASPFSVRAQESVKGPIYIIQPGDSLSAIASRFNVSLDALMAANNIADANNIAAGDRLIIPGIPELDGAILNTAVVRYGQTLHSISRIHQVSEEFLRKLNHITSPSELYAGVGIVYPEREGDQLNAKASLDAGMSFLELSVLQNQNPWALAETNYLANTWSALPGDVLYASASSAQSGDEGLPKAFDTVSINPLPMVQGSTTEIRVTMKDDAAPSGQFIGRPLNFFRDEDGSWVALQGVYALQEPGAYPLALEAALPNGNEQRFEQPVLVLGGSFPREETLLVEPATIDPTVTEPELRQIESIVAPANPDRYWQGLFQNPAYFTDCLNSGFGKRRTYIGIDTGERILGFHSGVDYCGGVGVPIYAPANGVIVFANLLTVRGNATIIDHGWGVYSGLWHQSEIKVTVGQYVKAGELIGLVGGTGRVTGAHLHWEVWVNGVQVNPLEWLETAFP